MNTEIAIPRGGVGMGLACFFLLSCITFSSSATARKLAWARATSSPSLMLIVSGSNLDDKNHKRRAPRLSEGLQQPIIKTISENIYLIVAAKAARVWFRAIADVAAGPPCTPLHGAGTRPG